MSNKLYIPPTVEECMKTFTKAGFRIYIVGGPLRDMLMGKPPVDWDFATNATPEEMLKLFPNAKYENTFGTVMIPQSPYPFEVTPFRKEGRYTDNRHPDEIEWAETIQEDVLRRDFTMNALAYDGEELVDEVKGHDDIAQKIIRAVGEPEKRFEEDALRMMRAVRFASQLGFTIEEQTRSAIEEKAELIRNVSWERIRDEFIKILASDRPSEGIMLLKEVGLLEQIMPELTRCFKIDQVSPERHHTDDVGTHLVKSLANCPSEDPIVRFAALIHDIGKAETREIDEETGVVTFYNHEIVGATIANNIGERYRLSKKDRFRLVKLVRYHMFSVEETQTDKAVRRFIRRVGKENIQDMLDVRTGDRVGSGVPETSWRTELFKKRIIEVQKKPFEIRDLKISGEDIMKELDIKPGPKIGMYLKQLFEEVVDAGLNNNQDTLIKRLHELASS